MEKEEKPKKNHWTSAKVNEACQKINNEIYKRNRQAPIAIKLDDLAIFLNDRITRRGIAKGLVCVQENLNKAILEVQKNTVKILLLTDIEEQIECITKIQQIIKIEIWTDIRFLMINKAITPGEITELIRRQLDIDSDLERWLSSMKRAISAEG